MIIKNKLNKAERKQKINVEGEKMLKHVSVLCVIIFSNKIGIFL